MPYKVTRLSEKPEIVNLVLPGLLAIASASSVAIGEVPEPITVARRYRRILSLMFGGVIGFSLSRLPSNLRIIPLLIITPIYLFFLYRDLQAYKRAGLSVKSFITDTLWDIAGMFSTAYIAKSIS